jgi:hypothetical protein
VGPWTGLDGFGKSRIRSPDRSARSGSLYRLRCAGSMCVSTVCVYYKCIEVEVGRRCSTHGLRYEYKRVRGFILGDLRRKNRMGNIKMAGGGRRINLQCFYSSIYPTICNVTLFILSGYCSTCFGWYLHPSSGAQTTVSTASGICHTVTATWRYRGR